MVPCDVPQVMGGRRINVERTVGGGGAKDDRKKKLSSLREMQGKQMTQTVKQLCEDILPAADTEAEEASWTDPRQVESATGSSSGSGRTKGEVRASRREQQEQEKEGTKASAAAVEGELETEEQPSWV